MKEKYLDSDCHSELNIAKRREKKTRRQRNFRLAYIEEMRTSQNHAAKTCGEDDSITFA